MQAAKWSLKPRRSLVSVRSTLSWKGVFELPEGIREKFVRFVSWVRVANQFQPFYKVRLTYLQCHVHSDWNSCRQTAEMCWTVGIYGVLDCWCLWRESISFATPPLASQRGHMNDNDAVRELQAERDQSKKVLNSKPWRCLLKVTKLNGSFFSSMLWKTPQSPNLVKLFEVAFKTPLGRGTFRIFLDSLKCLS